MANGQRSSPTISNPDRHTAGDALLEQAPHAHRCLDILKGIVAEQIAAQHRQRLLHGMRQPRSVGQQADHAATIAFDLGAYQQPRLALIEQAYERRGISAAGLTPTSTTSAR